MPGFQTGCEIPQDAGLYAGTPEHSEDIDAEPPGKPPVAARRPVFAGWTIAPWLQPR
jgi:hypothetical protein